MDWLGFLGRLHVVVVHFPIALLIVAGAVELWRGARRQLGISPLAAGCLVLGAISAVVAMVLGLIHQRSFSDSDLLEAHEWLGIATAITSVITVALLLAYWKNKWWAEASCRLGIFLSAILVSATGYFGGDLSRGAGFLWLGRENPAPTIPTTQPATQAAKSEEDDAYYFVDDIYPILKESCINCHRYGKQRGGLRLDSVQSLFKGGKSGPAIMKGHGEQSLIIARLRGQGGKDRMPKDKPPLSEEKIKSISEWIDEGAK